MRDATILAAMSETEAKVAHDVQLLAKQVMIVRARQEAIEETLFGNRLRLPFFTFCALVNPKWAKELVDRWTSHIFQKYEEDVQKAAALQKNQILTPQGPIGILRP